MLFPGVPQAAAVEHWERCAEAVEEYREALALALDQAAHPVEERVQLPRPGRVAACARKMLCWSPFYHTGSARVLEPGRQALRPAVKCRL